VRGGNNIVTLRPAWKFVIWTGSDSFLVQPTSPCRRTNSIVSLEGEDCSCAELQVSSCYRGWKKISGDECNLKNVETRAGIKVLFSCRGKAPKEIYAILTETWGEVALSFSTVKIWVVRFKRGYFSTWFAPGPGWHKTLITPCVIDEIDELTLEDRRNSAKLVAEQMGVSRGRVGSIIHEDLDMRKLPSYLVTKHRNAYQEFHRCQSAGQNLEF